MDIAKWRISAPTPWEKTIYDPFQDADIGSQFPLQKARDNYIRRVMRAAVIHTCPRHLSVSRDPVGKRAKLVYAISLPPLPRERSNPFDSCLYITLPLGSLPLPPRKCKCSKAGTSGLKWWPTRSMTWTTTWQSSADCRSGQLPVIYDSKPSSSPIKIKDSAFPQQSDSTGPSAR